MLNDVVAGPGGGFFVTHMMPRGNAVRQALNFARASLGGAAIGHVLRWSSEDGFRIVPGTEGPVPNGIERSKDGTRLFINYSGRGEVRRVEHRTGRIEAQASFEPLDNVTWAPDGRLLVAAARAGAAEMMACTSLESGQCAAPFAILAVDADTLRAEEIYVGGPATPSGAGTVGTMLRDGTLLVGTFAGDRVVRVAPTAPVRTK
jgi:hypothetical protein